MNCRNTIVVIMDDLAYGDLACHGNPYTKTPALDAMHAASVRGLRHCSGPLCTPARASLMTGRYHLRTRAFDTFCGRSTIDATEPVLAQTLQQAGFATACFGKWHLGDTYPARPQDLGFQTTLVHRSGGLGQPGDLWQNHLREGDSYFDPMLLENGKCVQKEGYCTDVFFDATLEYIRAHKDQRFFIYLATNAPHTPLIVADEWADPYRQLDLPEAHAKLYGMVANIDWNMGRLRALLQELGLADDTLVLYTSDHGPCGGSVAKGEDPSRAFRWNAGLRGLKGTCYEGGIRVPCLWEQGQHFSGSDLQRPTHVIDVAPTILGACGVTDTAAQQRDGRDLSALLYGSAREQDAEARQVFMQWHRGDAPVPRRNFAVIEDQWKLVRVQEGSLELFDLSQDHGEQQDCAASEPEICERLLQAYDDWFVDISATRGPTTFDPARLHVGSEQEPVTTLNQNDWRLVGGVEGWRRDDIIGRWLIHADVAQEYQFILRFLPRQPAGQAEVEIDGQRYQAQRVDDETASLCVHLAAGQHSVMAWRRVAAPTPQAWGGHYVPALCVDISLTEASAAS